MLKQCKKVALTLFVVVLLYPFAFAYADGEFYTDAEIVRFSGKKKSKKVKKAAPIHHHKIIRNSRPRQAKKHHYYQPDCCCKPKYHKHKKRHCKQPKIVISETEEVIERAPKCETLYELCDFFPPRRVRCKIINPADIVDSTCMQFIHKLKTCQAGACQAPYSQDPTVKTKWQIHGKNGDRCIVSSTTENIGIKDSNGKPIPVTQMCEYDKQGIKGLIERFIDQTERYYHTSTCDRFEGIHNCTINTRGQTIQDAVKEPNTEINMPPPSNNG